MRMKDYHVSKLQIKYYNTDTSRKKQNKSKKMDEPFLHFEIIKQMVKFTMKVSLGTDKASLSKNDSLENKKATIYKCSRTFYIYQELILCFHYTLGQPKFSIPLTVKCYYSEIISIVDILTITQVITPFFFTYIHNSNHQGRSSHTHDRDRVETYTLK